MPELPDIVVYISALERRLIGQPLQRVRIGSPFVLRTVDPPIDAVIGRRVRAITRIGKRIAIGFDEELSLVIHLMIAGRLRWKAPGAKIPGRLGLAAFDFPEGTLLFTEAGTKKRAALHVVRGADALAAHDPGGLDVLSIDRDEFSAALWRENHTLKRALTDPHIFSGIGNAYSDEILHRARLSPLQLTRNLTEEQLARLYDATQSTLIEWMNRLLAEVGDGFPEKVTAFRADMAVHGKFGQPCPVCGTKAQRIVYAENEANYCARCQTEGRLLADRSLSRLLKSDWPKRIE